MELRFLLDDAGRLTPIPSAMLHQEGSALDTQPGLNMSRYRKYSRSARCLDAADAKQGGLATGLIIIPLSIASYVSCMFNDQLPFLE
jgi:hypothetical protein